MRKARKDWFARIQTAHNAFSEIPFSVYYRTRILPLFKDAKTTPKLRDAFKAFELVPFERVKVVIVGQDPHYQVLGRETYATGLAFALNPKVLKGTSLKDLKGGKSLKTILNAIASELGKTVSDSPATDLKSLARDGVLLLNTALTTQRGVPEAHLKVWKSFTAAVLLSLNSRTEPIYFVLTCKSAKAFAPLIQAPHKIFFNYKHPTRCWRVSSRLKQKKAEISFFSVTGKRLGINWAAALGNHRAIEA